MLLARLTSVRARGTLLCLLAAVGFGAMAIFTKLAYRAGFDVVSLLAVRFVLAAAVLWVVVAIRRPARPTRRQLGVAVAMGAVGYAVQALLFFAAVRRLDASLASLLLYTYPALVCLGAIALRREPPTRRRVGALGLASAGAVLVLLGGGAGALDGLGAVLALAASLAYTAYILVADRVVGDADPLLLTTVMATAAAVSLGAVSVATGGPHLDVAPIAWLWAALIAVVSTVLPLTAFLLGLGLLGPSTASIVCTLEPVVTVGLAVAVFGDRLDAAQTAGGALVLAAVVVVNARRRAPRPAVEATAAAG